MDGQQYDPPDGGNGSVPSPEASLEQGSPAGSTSSGSAAMPQWWTRWKRLPAWGKIAAIGGVVILCCCGGTALALIVQPQPEAPSPDKPATATAPGSSPPPTSGSPSPLIERRTVTETQAIPFERTTVDDPSLPIGTRKVRTPGVPGEKTLTFELTLTNGLETERKRVNETVTRNPVTEVTAIGTAKTSCDPNYSGACVPIAPDVDCLGGGGDGPAFVAGPVTVIGEDIYGLDGNHDGIGCE